MPIHVTTSTTQSLSNKTFVDHLSTTGIVYSNTGSSNSWSSAYTTLNAQSASNIGATSIVSSNSSIWDNTYTTVNSNSATNWSYQGTDLKNLSGNWQNTYTTVTTNSGSWGGGGSSSPDDANLVVGISLFL